MTRDVVITAINNFEQDQSHLKKLVENKYPFTRNHIRYAIQYEDEIEGLLVVNTASHPWKKGKPWLPFRIISNPIYGKLFTNTFAMMYGQTTISSSADSNFPNGIRETVSNTL